MEKLRICMLGGCSLSYGDRTVDDSRQHARKPWLLLEYLVTFRNREIPLEELADLLYPEGGGTGGALKTLVYRVRSLLEELGTPDSREIIVVSRGSYAWNTGTPLELDTDRFERACQRAAGAGTLPAERLAACREAVGLYRGDFLPRAAGERWAAPLAAYYRNLYKHTVRVALELLAAGEQWEETAEICAAAIAVDGYEEAFHFHLIRALIRLGRAGEASERYKRMYSLFYSELGAAPPAEMASLYREIHRLGGREEGGEEDLAAISQFLLRDDRAGGAFLCELEVFKDIYCLEARSAARSQRGVYLGLLSAVMRDGSPPPLKLLNNYMDRLADCIRGSLRRGDVAAKYSAAQYVLLLPTSSAENGRLALERIVSRFVERYPRCPLLLRPSIRPVDTIPEPPYQIRRKHERI